MFENDHLLSSIPFWKALHVLRPYNGFGQARLPWQSRQCSKDQVPAPLHVLVKLGMEVKFIGPFGPCALLRKLHKICDIAQQALLTYGCAG